MHTLVKTRKNFDFPTKKMNQNVVFEFRIEFQILFP